MFEKTMNVARKYGAKVLPVTAGAGALALAGSAHAAVPEAVTTAIEAAGADGITVATAVLVAIVGIWAFKLIRRGL